MPPTRGIIIADTKFEFGFIDGKLAIIDEVPHARLQPLLACGGAYVPGSRCSPASTSSSCATGFPPIGTAGNPPHLPQEVIEKTSQKYIAAYEMISGRKFDFLSPRPGRAA